MVGASGETMDQPAVPPGAAPAQVPAWMLLVALAVGGALGYGVALEGAGSRPPPMCDHPMPESGFYRGTWIAECGSR